MPIVNKKSNAVAAHDSRPQILPSLLADGGRLREKIGYARVSNTDSAGSSYRLLRIGSGDRISRLLLSSNDISGASIFIGLSEIASVNNGAVIDVGFFADSRPLSPAWTNAEATHEKASTQPGTGFGFKDVEKPLWEVLRLPSDPGKQYDIHVRLGFAATSAGTIVLRLEYVDGN